MVRLRLGVSHFKRCSSVSISDANISTNKVDDLSRLGDERSEPAELLQLIPKCAISQILPTQTTRMSKGRVYVLTKDPPTLKSVGYR